MEEAWCRLGAMTPNERPLPADGPDARPPGTPGLRLVPLDAGTPEAGLLRAAVLRHRLGPGQRRFVQEPASTLPRADADPARTPFAVVDTPEEVGDAAAARRAAAGFGIVDRGPVLRELTDAPQRSVLLRAFYIVPERQGRGLGRAACGPPLDVLVAALAPEAQQVLLTVNEGNPAAERAYRAAGFTRTGRGHVGGAGPQHVLSRPLRPAGARGES